MKKKEGKKSDAYFLIIFNQDETQVKALKGWKDTAC